MARLPVVCPVCDGREELAASTVNEVVSLLCCALPSCPECGWAREEDNAESAWDRLEDVYHAHVNGEEIKQSWVEDLTRGP
jgi:hypothetical protein